MRWFIGFLCMLLLSGCLNGEAKAIDKSNLYSARVIRVSDGDSVQVRDAHGRKRKIRMAYIDAPELRQTFGRHSHHHLRRLIHGRKVQVEPFTYDQYGREVSRILLDGNDINLIQIQKGMAWHYRSIAKREQQKKDYQRYQKAEKKARQAHIGLWKNKRATPPWRWRHQHRR